jgi:DNA (cytosine-5)-methyltransferase 1
MAGAQIVAAIDSDPLAVATYKDNFPGAKIVEGRLDERNGVRLIGDIGRVDLVLASPECTNHSVARGARAIDTASLESGLYVLPFIQAWKPRFLVLENVARMQRWAGWNDFLRRLSNAGYEHAVIILDAQHFGVPQARRRMFLLASREVKPPDEIRSRNRKIRTAAEILDPPGTYVARRVYGRSRPLAEATIGRIKRGRKFVEGPDDFIIVYYGSDAAGGWQSLDRPLRTLTTLDRFGLVSGVGRATTLRMLQVPELKRAMGFPDDFKLDRGSRRDRIRLIGNAVCPLVMRAVIDGVLNAASTTQPMRLRSRELAAV